MIRLAADQDWLYKHEGDFQILAKQARGQNHLPSLRSGKLVADEVN